MAYDGFYSELSTRGATNEVLNLAIQTKNEIDAAVLEFSNTSDEIIADSAAAGAAAAEGVLVTKVNLIDLADSVDPAKGSSLVGWGRQPLSSAIASVRKMLDGQNVNVFEAQFANLITVKPNPSDPNTWDWTPALQAFLNYLVSNPLRPLKGILPAITYNITSDLVINTRNNGVSANFGLLDLEGVGSGAIGGVEVGALFKCTTAGVNILRMCEEQPASVNVSGAYPGGGAGVVTLPLNFLRRIRLKNINLQGDSSSPLSVNGFVGRGTFSSEFINCGLEFLNYGIRLGKAEATSQEQSADSVDLDYCERNTFSRCMFNRVQTHIHILAGDITRIEGCTHNPCPTVAGRIYYFSGGNDYYYVVGNILQPRDVSGTALTKPIHTVGGRGYSFHRNHIEGIRGRLLEQLTQACEVVSFTENMLFADVALSTYPFGLFLQNQGKFYLHKNNIVASSVSPRYINVQTPGSLFETLHLDYDDNRAVTAIGGSTQLSIISNLEGSNLNFGRYGDPLYLGKAVYIWTTSAGIVRYKTTKPTSQTDGFVLGQQAETVSTVAFPGVTVNAGSFAAINLTVTGAAFGRFTKLSPDVTLGDLLWVSNTTSGSSVRVVFFNATGGNITIPAGTWNYKVENL